MSSVKQQKKDKRQVNEKSVCMCVCCVHACVGGACKKSSDSQCVCVCVYNSFIVAKLFYLCSLYIWFHTTFITCLLHCTCMYV